jgi:hypothetical protein
MFGRSTRRRCDEPRAPINRHARLRLVLRSANMGVVSAIIICLWILAITVRQGSSAKFIYFDF